MRKSWGEGKKKKKSPSVAINRSQPIAKYEKLAATECDCKMVMLLCRLNSSFKNSAQPFPLEFFVFLQIQISQIIKITTATGPGQYWDLGTLTDTRTLNCWTQLFMAVNWLRAALKNKAQIKLFVLFVRIFPPVRCLGPWQPLGAAQNVTCCFPCNFNTSTLPKPTWLHSLVFF